MLTIRHNNYISYYFFYYFLLYAYACIYGRNTHFSSTSQAADITMCVAALPEAVWTEREMSLISLPRLEFLALIPDRVILMMAMVSLHLLPKTSPSRPGVCLQVENAHCLVNFTGWGQLSTTEREQVAVKERWVPGRREGDIFYLRVLKVFAGLNLGPKVKSCKYMAETLKSCQPSPATR